MKYVANPVIVDAHRIVSVGQPRAHGGIAWWSVDLALDNGENVTADAGMLARYTPEPGDYWVIQADGYVYLNPKNIFERKYSPLNEAQPGADQPGKDATTAGIHVAAPESSADGAERQIISP